jgi:hypothetical protein
VRAAASFKQGAGAPMITGQPRGRVALLVALAISVMALGGIGTAIVMRLGPKPQPSVQPPASAAPSAAPAVDSATPSAAPVACAAPSASAAPTASQAVEPHPSDAKTTQPGAKKAPGKSPQPTPTSTSHAKPASTTDILKGPL